MASACQIVGSAKFRTSVGVLGVAWVCLALLWLLWTGCWMLAWRSLTFCLFCRPCIRLGGCSMAGHLLHSPSLASAGVALPPGLGPLRAIRSLEACSAALPRFFRQCISEWRRSSFTRMPFTRNLCAQPFNLEYLSTNNCCCFCNHPRLGRRPLQVLAMVLWRRTAQDTERNAKHA